MMNIIWVVNHKMRDLAIEMGEKSPTSGSWLVEMSKAIVNTGKINLHVICPSNIDDQRIVINGVTYYTIKMNNFDKFIGPRKKILKSAEALIEEINPDIIHLQGSEFAFNLAFAKNKSIPSLLSIQGLISQITDKKYYYAGIIDKKHWKAYMKTIMMTVPERIKMIRNKYRAKAEIRQIKLCDHIVGRTSWDRAHTYFLNRGAKYFHVQETIRSVFYQHEWNSTDMRKYSVFAAGGFASPLKGFHKILEAIILLKDEFPDILIRVPGPDLLNSRNVLGYSRILSEFVMDHKLENNICFLGNLTEQQMAYEFKMANAYVMSSSIENSSNTLAEAMVVGTPSVVSFVGGTSSLIADESEGLFYRFGDVEHMAWHIRRIFRNDINVEELSRNARDRARKQYSNTKSCLQMLKVYEEIANDKTKREV